MAKSACHHTGADTHARVGGNDDGTWFSRCHCRTLTCPSGTYDEAVAALDAHRGPPPAVDRAPTAGPDTAAVAAALAGDDAFLAKLAAMVAAGPPTP